MKRLHIIASAVMAFFLSIGTFSLRAQDAERGFFDCLTLPIEIGLAVDCDLPAGMYMKMSLEYRPCNTKGWYASAEYDDYDMKYTGVAGTGVNALSGTEKNTNILLGAGYRFPLVDDKLSIACLVQPGLAIATLENVGLSADVHDADRYELSDVDYLSFAGKLTCQLDYFLNKNFSIFCSAGYIHYWGDRPLSNSSLGTVVTTLGFTTFF